MSYARKRALEANRTDDVDRLERTFSVTRYGDITFFNKKHKYVKALAGRECPEKIAALFYDILASER